MKPRSCWIVVILLILHQDYWNWTSESLWFGFLPYTLAYHAGISLLAAIVWWCATCVCWPDHLDAVWMYVIEWTGDDAGAGVFAVEQQGAVCAILAGHPVQVEALGECLVQVLDPYAMRHGCWIFR